MRLTMAVLATVSVMMVRVAAPVRAQTVAAQLAAGDSAYATLDVARSLTRYEAAIALDSVSYEALWKASRSAIDLGEFERNDARRDSLFKLADRYARRAVRANPGDAEGHFNLARTLGRTALSVGPRERIGYGKAVREEALACLKVDAKHPGCLHVMGVWNAEIMRLNGVLRFIAKRFLGGAIFETASWEEARRDMEGAVAADPERITHHLDLARVYADIGQKDQARAQYEIVLKGKTIDYNDAHYREQAAAELKRL